MKYNDKKIQELFTRVYNNAMIETEEVSDKVDLVEYSKKVFGDGAVNPDPSLLNQFNNLIVKQADEIAKPKVTSMIGLLANTTSANRGDVVQIDIPRKNKIKLIWSAKGSGVDLIRVGDKDRIVAIPETFSTGVYYEPMDFVTNPVVALPNLVNMIAEAKVKLYFAKISELTAASISSGKIPAANVVSGANITYVDYNKLVSTLMRYGGKPIFVSDTLLIDHVASQIASATPSLLSDDMKDEFLTDLVPTRLGRSTAVNLVNPFVDETNSATELPVNEGYMFAGGVNKKPFEVVEFGGLRQKSEQDIETERVVMKLFQDADIKLMFGEAVGYVKDTSITL